MKAAERLGRWGGVRARRQRRLPALERARKLFDRLSSSLDAAIDRLDTELPKDGADRAKELGELVRQYQRILATVLELEAKLECEAAYARPGKDLIDLEAARTEIARRLARLAE